MNAIHEHMQRRAQQSFGQLAHLLLHRVLLLGVPLPGSQQRIPSEAQQSQQSKQSFFSIENSITYPDVAITAEDNIHISTFLECVKVVIHTAPQTRLHTHQLASMKLPVLFTPRMKHDGPILG